MKLSYHTVPGNRSELAGTSISLDDFPSQPVLGDFPGLRTPKGNPIESLGKFNSITIKSPFWSNHQQITSN